MDTLLFLVLIFLAYEFLRAYRLSRRSGFKFYLLQTTIWVSGFLVTVVLLVGVYASGQTSYRCWWLLGALLPSVIMSSLASRFRNREIAKLRAASPEAWQSWERALRNTTWVKRIFFQYPDVRNLATTDAEIAGQHKALKHKGTTSGYLKNYTAQIKPLAPELVPEKIKDVTEEILRQARSKPVFCFGTIARSDDSDDQALLFEIAAGMSKDALADLLKALETKLPLQLERVGYGWVITGSEEPTTASQVSHLRCDPYAKATPQSEARKVYVFNRRGLRRFIYSLGLFLVMLTLFAVSAPLRTSSDGAFILHIISSMVMVAFLIENLEGSVWPWSYASHVMCDQEGLEIKRWLQRTPVRLTWDQISGLDIFSSRWNIHCNGHSYRLLAGEEFGLSEGPTLAKTILQRASLHFVEVNMALVIYRRFDA